MAERTFRRRQGNGRQSLPPDRVAPIRLILLAFDCLSSGGSELFDSQAFLGGSLIVRDRAFKFALQILELRLASGFGPLGIGSCHRLISETVRRRPRIAHEILRLRDVGPYFRAHQCVKRRAACLRLLRLRKRTKCKTHPSNHGCRPVPDVNKKKQVPFHFNVRVLEL